MKPYSSHLIYLLISLLFAASASAHPVAQGSMEFSLKDDHLVVMARVSNEEVFVATAQAEKTPADLTETFNAHGEYLLRHIKITADGKPLVGKTGKINIPEDRSTKGFAGYELRYDYAPQKMPREIFIEQNVLNDISYAPGNPWEATYLVTTNPAGIISGGATLFTHKAPLHLLPQIAASAHAVVPSARGVFVEFFLHGFHHILEGWDHLLFVTALVLAARRWRELIAVVSVFTLAHSITLVLSTFDLVRLSSRIVEPMIAASIVIIALQNAVRPAAARGWLRLALAFGFGLFHGLGFAGGLLDAMQEMSGFSLGAALGGFSLGVELGHQVVVIPVFALLLLVRSYLRTAEKRDGFSYAVLRGGSVLIAVAGAFYLVSALRG